jgi:2-methylcitrate dehydratase PrpD
MEFSQTGGMIKRLHAGRAAEGGVLAAYLAKDGFTGPHTVLEGLYGYCNVFTSKPELERLTDDLGQRFAIEEITVKPYACCSDQHGTIDCVTKIVRDNGLSADDVKRITIHTYEKVIKQNSAREWPTVMSAQYSVVFSAAGAFYYDLGDPKTYDMQTIRDPRIAAIADKVVLVQDPAFQALYPKKMPTRVDIECVDGHRFEAESFGAKGHFENSLSAAEIEAKFRKLTSGLVPTASVDRVFENIRQLDQAQSIAPLLALLAVDPAAAENRNAAA